MYKKLIKVMLSSLYGKFGNHNTLYDTDSVQNGLKETEAIDDIFRNTNEFIYNRFVKSETSDLE